jgi:putative PEP-CTERM system histidine kinase
MIPLTWLSLAAFTASALAVVIAGLLLVRPQSISAHKSLAALLGATAVAHFANGLSLLNDGHALYWRMLSMIAELLQPAALLYVGLAFLDPVERTQDAATRWRARTIGGLGLVLSALIVSGRVFEWQAFPGGHTAIVMSSMGHVALIFIVIAMALGLAQLELVLRASREPVRHRLKFIIIGLGGLAGYQIYQASQMLLLSVWHVEHVLVSSIVSIMALALIGYGLGRSRLREVLVHTYISQQALFGSVTFIVIGLYLLAVGALGEWFRRTNQPLGVGLSIVVVFGALVVLAIAAFSKTVRAEIRRFLSRNFYRSKYDYRAQWLHVTDTFQEAAEKEAIMDRLLDLLIKTFPTTTISIWSFREADRVFCAIRSMTPEKALTPLALSHPVVRELSSKDGAVLLDHHRPLSSGEDGVDGDPLAGSGVVLCFPIRAHGQLKAFMALGHPLHSDDYGADDCDLLQGISHYVSALLSHASLAEDRQASAELEALHRFSVFCLHDLKNLAARLSLVAQNAESHGRDPAFQESAMRTVSDTAKKMTALMTKLSFKSLKPGSAATAEPFNVAELIEEIVAPLRSDGAVRIKVTAGSVGPVIGVREQIQQVLLNVILNARQAMAGDGEIRIITQQSEEATVILVEDTGRGIPPAMLETLFRPSQSSRPGGLGVGLYQCKQIVEAHRGIIQIKSVVGTGTQVRIEFPSGLPVGSNVAATACSITSA